MEFQQTATSHARVQEVDAYMRDQLDDHSSFIAETIQELISRDDKRIRPILTLYIGEMVGADAEHLLDLAAAVEMLHIATLIHEDLIDDGSLRRGGKAIASQWHPAAIVLAGDFVFALASKLAANTQSTVVMEMFAQTLATITNGDVTQLFSNGSRFNREAYLQWVYTKTASAFELAAGAAAMLAGAGDDIFRQVRQLGKSFGMAHKILADVADFYPNGSSKAQSVGSSLKQGIITLPLLHYSQSNPDDPDLELLNKPAIQANGSLDRLITAIGQSESLGKSFREAQEYINQFFQVLKEFPVSPPRLALEELADISVDGQFTKENWKSN